MWEDYIPITCVRGGERITGAISVGDDRIFRDGMEENKRIAYVFRSGDDRIFRNGMEENIILQKSFFI